jgi:catechol 2,3-dioxygenase-like lactoylglutathione lyase family enzyme
MLPTTSTTVFQVADIPAATTFYRDILGFTEDFRYDNYAGVYLGKIELHLCAHTIWNRPLGGGAVVILAEEVDDYCALIRQRGANILADPADQYYGLRDFVVADPDGNVLTFSAELPTLTV